MTVQRWTDEMLDELASSTSNMKGSIIELRESMTEVRGSITELRDSVTEVGDSVDGLRVTAQALLQLAAQSQRDTELLKQRQAEDTELFKQRQAENDQRFNILLEEVRYLRRRSQEDQQD